MIFDEANAFYNWNGVAHDHVLQDDDGFWFCQVDKCHYGLSVDQMPQQDQWADLQDRIDEDIRLLADLSRTPEAFLRGGKQAAYEEMVRTLEETIGPSKPLVAGGKVRGRMWDESFSAHRAARIDEHVRARKTGVVRLETGQPIGYVDPDGTAWEAPL